jgi:hypothetical protein
LDHRVVEHVLDHSLAQGLFEPSRLVTDLLVDLRERA